VSADEALADFRREIDSIDEQLVDALSRRLALCARVGVFKRERGIPMMQPHRVEEVKRRCAQLGADKGLSEPFVYEIYSLIIDHACRLEDEIIDAKED